VIISNGLLLGKKSQGEIQMTASTSARILHNQTTNRKLILPKFCLFNRGRSIPGWLRVKPFIFCINFLDLILRSAGEF
jgi:hypothetical protein